MAYSGSARMGMGHLPLPPKKKKIAFAPLPPPPQQKSFFSPFFSFFSFSPEILFACHQFAPAPS